MKYHNAYPSTDDTFFVLVCTRVGRYFDRGYPSLEEAAWQADRAKHVLNNHGLIGRLSAYNFPERLAVEPESAWSVLPKSLVDFYCAHLNGETPVTEADAIRVEEAKQLALSNIERQRLIDEETQKLIDEKNVVHRAQLSNLVEKQADILKAFDALALPKSTRERNSLTHTLGLLCSRLAQL